MRLPKTTLKQRLLIIITGMTSAAIAILFFVIIPTVREIMLLEQHVTETQQFLENQYERTKSMRKSIVRLPEIEAAVKGFSLATIRRGEELSVITTIETIAELHHINQTLDVTARPGESSVTFSFVAQGTFQDLAQYIRALEVLPYYVFIDQLHFENRNPKTGDVDNPLLTLRFDAVIYLQSEE